MESVQVQRGQPKKYTPEDLLSKFIEYTDSLCNLTKKVYNSKTHCLYDLEYNKPCTLFGFCAFAKIHRDTLNSYKINHSEEYSDTVQYIYTFIAAQLEENALLYSNHAGFTQFVLTNMGTHQDKREVNNTHNINVTLSAEDRRLRIAELQRKSQPVIEADCEVVEQVS